MTVPQYLTGTELREQIAGVLHRPPGFKVTSDHWETNRSLREHYYTLADAVIAVLSDYLRAVDEDVRAALMHAEEVILSLPQRWNDPLVPDECGEAFQRAYASLRALSVVVPDQEKNE